MYIDLALERLNQIEWDKIGTKGDRQDAELFSEFTRRLAHYFKKINLQNTNPPMWQFIKLFYRGDFTEDIESYKHSTFEEIEARFPQLFEKIPQNTHFVKNLALSYLQMAIDIDNSEADPDDLELFEPIWIIFQRGGLIYRGEHSSSAVEVLKGGFFPLGKYWYDGNGSNIHGALNLKPLELKSK